MQRVRDPQTKRNNVFAHDLRRRQFHEALQLGDKSQNTCTFPILKRTFSLFSTARRAAISDCRRRRCVFAKLENGKCKKKNINNRNYKIDKQWRACDGFVANKLSKMFNANTRRRGKRIVR